MTREEREGLIKHLEYDRSIGADYLISDRDVDEIIKALEQELKVGYCKDCKWWKDSDGFYRRGGHAESQCPINRREVFEGNGYCYMFEPQKRSDEG